MVPEQSRHLSELWAPCLGPDTVIPALPGSCSDLSEVIYYNLLNSRLSGCPESLANISYIKKLMMVRAQEKQEVIFRQQKLYLLNMKFFPFILNSFCKTGELFASP